LIKGLINQEKSPAQEKALLILKKLGKVKV
jgi:hypothetical protein